MRAWGRGLALAALSGLLGGCETMGYLAQSVSGHFDLMSGRRPVVEVLNDPATPPSLRAQLRLSQDLLSFAHERLQLPSAGSYQSFVALDRPFVSWTVVVTPRLSVIPLASCFPLLGCIAYRGYFDATSARIYADKFEDSAFDTYIGGAGAYSTLGWFEDPILSTMTRRDTAGLAAVLFHELAHQKLYVPNDTTFNESYAVALEQIGVPAWFELQGQEAELAAYKRRMDVGRRFAELVRTARERLVALYAGPESEADKLSGKAEVFVWLRAAHSRLRAEFGGVSPYTRWADTPINNAKLALAVTYADHVDAFLALHRQVNGDMAKFHARVAALGALSLEERRAALAALGEGALASSRQTY